MISWSLKRRVLYISGVLSFFAIILGWALFIFTYQPSTCFDSKQNQDEVGIDCGGGCERVCVSQLTEPIILFNRSFEVANSIYNAIAYVENRNFTIGTQSVGYKFTLLDSDNELITEREGRTFIQAGKISPIFEAGINTEGKVPARTFFEFTDDPYWTYVESSAEIPLVVKNQTLENQDTRPRINAVLENVSIREFRNFEVVATVFNSARNAIATSRTVVEYLPKRSEIDLVFTWPKPFTKELAACAIPVDVMLLIDTSGSMNDDGGDPPQPLADAKEAAIDFVGRLTKDDRAGLITFATNSTVEQPFTIQHDVTESTIDELSILPEEESGFTNLGDALLSAVGELQILNNGERDAENDRRQKVIVLLTDGKANAPEDPGGEPHALEQAELAKQSGFSIYTIGLGEKINAPFLRTVASVNDGTGSENFYKAVESKDLTTIYRQISDSLCERGPAIIEIIPRIPDRAIGE